MSMHRYANAGPVMQGLAAMVEIDPPIEPMPATLDDLRHGQAFVTEAFRQMAEMAQRIADLEQQLDACQFFNRLMTVEAQVQQISNDVNAWLEQAQAQQTAMLARMYGGNAQQTAMLAQQRQTAAQAFNGYAQYFSDYGNQSGT